MSEEILCPVCGDDDELRGEVVDDTIRVTCGRCATSWDRDTSPRCRTCGAGDLRPVAKAVWEKSRGTQLSVAAMTVVHLCPECDRELLARALQSNSPLPPDENPAASGER